MLYYEGVKQQNFIGSVTTAYQQMLKTFRR
jgi:hypothetical protein